MPQHLFPYSIFSQISASLEAQTVKCMPAMQETGVWSQGWEDPLEKEMATHSSILAWRIPRTKEPGELQSMGSRRVRHDWATSLSFSFLKSSKNSVTFCCVLFFPKMNHLWCIIIQVVPININIIKSKNKQEQVNILCPSKLLNLRSSGSIVPWNYTAAVIIQLPLFWSRIMIFLTENGMHKC